MKSLKNEEIFFEFVCEFINQKLKMGEKIKWIDISGNKFSEIVLEIIYKCFDDNVVTLVLINVEETTKNKSVIQKIKSLEEENRKRKVKIFIYIFF